MEEVIIKSKKMDTKWVIGPLLLGVIFFGVCTIVIMFANFFSIFMTIILSILGLMMTIFAGYGIYRAILSKQAFINVYSQGIKGEGIKGIEIIDFSFKYNEIKKVIIEKDCDLSLSIREGGKIMIVGIENAYEISEEINKRLMNTSQIKDGSKLKELDDLKKYKDLLDCGAITQEEFETKKKELLNL